MTIQSLPASTNFQLSYEDSIPNADKRAQAIEGVCENEFSVLTGWFGIPPGAFGASDRIQVHLERLDPHSGAAANNDGYHSGGKSNIHIDAQSAINNAANAAEIVKTLFVNELVEVFMSYNNQHGANKNSWKRNNSDGEALSQLCGTERFRTGHYLYVLGQQLFSDWSIVDFWLQNNGRPDWVSKPENWDLNPVSFGCGLLFLYYLKSQRGYSVPKIIQNGGASLEELYKNLTGQSNAFAAFNGLVSQYFPAGNTPLFHTFDDPFPLLDPVSRWVRVSVSQASNDAEESIVWSDTVHVSPFISKFCHAKDYWFEIDSTPETVSCAATVRGFGQPLFAWRVNGVDVPAGGGSIAIRASMLVEGTHKSMRRCMRISRSSARSRPRLRGRAP